MRYAIGIQIGFARIEAGIVSEGGFLIQKENVQNNPSDKEKMFRQVVHCVEQLMDHCSLPKKEIAGIGVGIPGNVDRHNGIALFQNNLPWKDFPIADRLQQAVGINAIIDNDVCMAAFAEWKEAGLQEGGLFVYMAISTGISCSIIKNGEFIRGAGLAGAAGLIPVLDPDQKRMIRFEQMVSAPALQARASRLFANEQLEAKDLFTKYHHGVPEVKQAVNELATSISYVLYVVASLLDPHKIVLGGSIAAYNPFLLELLKSELAKHLLPEQRHILDGIEISYPDNSQVVMGAGMRFFYT
ncbi:kinase [Sporosarcina globispora]|uniref:Kinase n=1 Tax=Sporosarcina globispora TaxID=1459 RepID=A0A0M0GK16_SPOGL|nr:ROK family protein [Sporosarcina globispora]KON90103.1 kinase [Sporosarcina globispora]